LYLDGVFVDHVHKRSEYFAHGRSRFEDLPKATRSTSGLRADSPKPQTSQERFMDAVEKARVAVHNGQAFQVVLSRRDYGRLTGDPLAFRVEGELAPGNDALDAFAAVFPAGTVSGAPKPRAMEILHDLEGTARGPYAGVVGYLSLNGNVDTAIAIRTLFADGPMYYLQ